MDDPMTSWLLTRNRLLNVLIDLTRLEAKLHFESRISWKHWHSSSALKC
jgi:hypothetical protein